MFDLLANALISMGTFLQQATTGSPEVDSIVSIIMSVVALGGLIIGFMKIFPQTRKYGQMLDAGYQKIVESEEMVGRVAKAIVETVPEVKEPLKKHGADLDYIDKRIKTGLEQLGQFRVTTVSGNKRASTVEDLPREDKSVF